MTPQELKSSILQLAIQGKLVEQRLEEGTGEELYQQILAEKQRLIKAGTIKKEKPLPEITEDEKPFYIPEGWICVRFGDAIYLISGTDFKPEEYNDKGKGIPYITGASSLSSNGVLVNRWTETPRVIANLGDVLLVCKGSGYGKTVICDIEQAHIARQIMAIRKTGMIDSDYIRYFLMANLSLIKANGQGVIPGIDRGSVLGMAFPLPPIAEQKRIVAKIEKLLPYIDRYEIAWSKLEDFNKRFPGDMQKSILQMAIQGKLVEQRPEEGTGEELYQQIQAEKQKLIKAGTIKREIPLQKITDDEIPFDIPESWKWVKLDNIAVSGLGKTLDKAKNTGDFQPYLCSINVYWSGIDLSNVKEARFEQNELIKYKLQKGDLLICEGGDVGRSAIWNSDDVMYYQNALHRVSFYGNINAYFYKYLLECYK
ncbi:MAG TPA: restriction endonuclease subunit S, partial [Negativicutes bacterium]|nr:restriction endonuclease subunit S [Negativicutes bacterium]